MTSGISFLDLLLSKATMTINTLIFIFCVFALLFKRKAIGRKNTKLVFIILAATGIYLLFIVWLIVMWG